MNKINNIKNYILKSYNNIEISNYSITDYNRVNRFVCNKLNYLNSIVKGNKIKNIILLFNDDIYSLISYNLLSSLKGITNFNLYIYGNIIKTKEYMNSKKNYIKINKKYINNTPNCLYINPYNPIYDMFYNKPIYKVLFNKFYSKKIKSINIIDKLTPEDIIICNEFYNISTFEYFNKRKKKIFLDYNNLFIKNNYIHYPKDKKIYFIKLLGNEKDNIGDLIDNINNNKNNIISIFYWCDNKEIFKDKIFNHLPSYLAPNENNTNLLCPDVLYSIDSIFPEYKPRIDNIKENKEELHNFDEEELWTNENCNI